MLACVHAGWRGTVAGVTGAALDAMAALGTRPGDVIAGIGPAIGPDRYQVGEDLSRRRRGIVSASTPPWCSGPMAPAGGCSTCGGSRLLLRAAGVADRHIHVAAVPTGADFFSNRSARPCGRFGLFARLRPRDGAP